MSSIWRPFYRMAALAPGFVSRPIYEIRNRLVAPRAIGDFNQYDEFVRKYLQYDFEGMTERDYLDSYYLDFKAFIKIFGIMPPKCDPFSDEYRNWEMSFFEFLAGKDYAFDLEGLNLNVQEENKRIPTIDFSREYRISQMRTYADFLEKAKPERGARVLEMGCGWGNLMELLGRNGCCVTGIDASESFAHYTAERLAAQNIAAKVINSSFYGVDSIEGIFDFVVFEASFHHCGEPLRLLKALYDKTAPDCRIYFLNEPINPFFGRPWGIIRYNGEAMLQIRLRGWLELGYRTDFFKLLLLKSGFKLQKSYNMYNDTRLFEAVKIRLAQ